VHHDQTDRVRPDIVANEAREVRVQCGVSISLVLNDAALVMRRLVTYWIRYRTTLDAGPDRVAAQSQATTLPRRKRQRAEQNQVSTLWETVSRAIAEPAPVELTRARDHEATSFALCARQPQDFRIRDFGHAKGRSASLGSTLRPATLTNDDT
jgi:hypothetical protein